MSARRNETPRPRRRHKPSHAESRPSVPWEPFLRAIERLDRAVNDLRRRAPDFSAATPFPVWQQTVMLGVPAIFTAALILLDESGFILWSLTLALPFLLIAIVRLVAVWHVLKRQPKFRRAPVGDRRFDTRLPTFSVLIPVYQEVAVIPDLVAAMRWLDYPPDRLEILFITEEQDQPTRHALLRAGLARNMRILTVPAGQPRTKPRALNYALQDARGILVTVYDAEDVPDRDQLRRAADAFIEGGPRLACVQAQLAIYNANQSFLSRQFALEYAALFRGLLPALAYLKLPIPLGGTSNHFRRDLLLKCGGWDPFNVTEDADLGIRIARLGYDVTVIQSATLEEAPAFWRTWRGQRTRWIKGWIQTYLVHMRHPRKLWRDLGTWQFMGFQVMIGGMILSFLVHPWFYILLADAALTGGELMPANSLLRWVCGGHLAIGYGAAWLLTIVTALGSVRRLWSAVWLPIYWLAMSWAAYCAVVDLIFRPFHWEKTAHGAGARHRDILPKSGLP
ncbi:glycosyltransferase [Hyphomicrobium denitrificans]|nr:glycosyltransferase [Hyphomicrobium denitrificans]